MNTETQQKMIELLLNDSMSELNKSIDTTLDDFKTALEAKIEGVKTAAYADIREVESYVSTEKPLVVNLGTVEAPKGKLVHKAFKTITKILSSTKRKEKNIMLVGGAGGGKTHLVGSVAEALKLPFYPMSVGLQTTKSDLLGFINATGIYMPSPIRLAYENGGVLLLDEFDAAHAGVITILNSLLANGHCSFPDKIVEKHKDFVCLCACNTYGKGGTMDYVGRNRLDDATLDRFIIVDVNYDENLEKQLTNHKEWTDIIKQIRKAIDKYGIKMIVSPRASMDGADLLDAGFSMDEVLEMCIFKGCDDDTKTKIKGAITIKQSTPAPSIGFSTRPADYNIYIDVNFNDLTYDVILNNPKFDSTIYEFPLKNFDIKLHCKNEYTPYLDNSNLYLNIKLNDNLLKEGWCNTKGDIKRFIDDLKNIHPRIDLNPNSILLSVLYKSKLLRVNLNTGDFTEEKV